MSQSVQLSQCHCVNLRRTANMLTDFYTGVLKEAGLTLPQYSLLKNIHLLERCSTTELARKVRLEHSTLVRNLRHLTKQNLIVDGKESGRKRSVWLITDFGREALEKAIPLWRNAQEQIENALGEDNMRKLNEILTHLQNLSGK